VYIKYKNKERKYKKEKIKEGENVNIEKRK
jgi:hypothetical protein